MAVVGIPVLHEDDALRAVRAADDLRHAVARLSEDLAAEHGVGLAVRVGVATGEVVAEGAAGGEACAPGRAGAVPPSPTARVSPPGGSGSACETWLASPTPTAKRKPWLASTHSSTAA